MRPHALRRLDRSDPLGPLGQRHRVPAGSRADVDHSRARGDKGPDDLQELLGPTGGRASEGRGAAVPVARIAVASVFVRGPFPIGDQSAPAGHPIHLVHATRLALGTSVGQPAAVPPGSWG